MDLPASGQGPLAGKKLEKAAPILQNVLCGIFVEAGEAQRVVWHLTYAAEAG